MTKFLTTLLGALLLSTAAQAGVVYQFHTTRAAVGDPEIVGEPGSAFSGVDLKLHLFDDGPVTFDGDGCSFEAAGIGAISGAFGAYPLCGTEPTFPEIPVALAWMTLDLQPQGALLVGTFFLNTLEETFTMASNPGGLWTGTYTSDFGDDGCFWSPTPCTFEGSWRLVSTSSTAVPEPGTFALMLVGLGILLTSHLAGRRAALTEFAGTRFALPR
ncbi:PEP-CTERM sorting domain-containing protein [Rhodospirillaceae bacterium SYSU D60014]|uniref:PEP-CTERM sorting domain-containing protein n=1 Tax=Virgifigura deserti TaxID=2268457 RepID=UPI000E66DBA9